MADELPCPEAKRTRYSGIDICSLNDKPCVLEVGGDCNVYEEFLEEQEDDGEEGSLVLA